ncbi:MAG: DNA polymerase IV [Candidatus Bathyarchaeia archaeon]
MSTRVIMLVDLDYFFAQCEELRNPVLRDKPVVVCVYSGRSEDSGAVSTSNYIARKYGVKSGMPIFLAKKKLESVDAAFLPVDHLFYEEVSRKVMNLLEAFADHFEQVGIDEAYLDVTERVHGSFPEAKLLAEAIKTEMRNQQRLTCSIGVGPNKLVAKIASDEKKPDGLTVIAPDQVKSFLAPLPVNRLIGVGTKTLEKMQTLGISKVCDLANYDVQKLIAVFGKTLGTYFHNASLGVDNEPVQERAEAESISRIATLKQDTKDLALILEQTDRICNDVYDRLVEEKLTFKTVSIIAITKDMKLHTRSRTFENPSNSLDLIKKTVAELFEKFQSDTEIETRRVGVKVSNFAGLQKGQKQITGFIEPA